MMKIVKLAFCLFFTIILLTSCNSPEPGVLDSTEEKSTVITEPSEIVLPMYSDNDTASIQHDDFVGEWYRTSIDRAFSATVTIKNQTEESFDFSFLGFYAANIGEIEGTAVFTGKSIAEFKHVPEYDETIFAKVEFILKNGNLHIRLADGNSTALGFGHNVSMDGEYTTSDPIYINADIINEILPTEDIREKMRTLLGNEVYEQVLFVIEYGLRYQTEDLTYSGFVNGAGQGVDLHIKGDKIYCLAYGLDLDGLVYKLYTNDEEYRDNLPSFMQIDRRDYEIQFVYKP